jgi:hypothetical protein
MERPWFLRVIRIHTVPFSGQVVLSLPCRRARLRARNRSLKGVCTAHSHSLEQIQEGHTQPYREAGLRDTHGVESVLGGGRESESKDGPGRGPAGRPGTRSRAGARRGKEERARGRARSHVGRPAGCTRSRGPFRRGKESELGDAPGRASAGQPGTRSRARPRRGKEGRVWGRTRSGGWQAVAATWGCGGSVAGVRRSRR